MADLKATYQILDYTPDRGKDSTSINYKGSFVVPIGMSDAQVTAALNVAGVQVMKVNGKKLNALPEAPPCSMRSLWKPRRLRFFLLDGRSLTIPVAERANLIAAARGISTILATLAPVSCVKLLGEEWANLMPIFGQETKTPASTALDPRGKTFSGLYDYESDSTNPFGGKVKVRYRVESEDDDAPPAFLNGLWTTANGVESPFSKLCPSRNKRIPRRYILSFLVDRGGETRVSKIEIPVSDKDSSDIRNLGESLAALPPVFCVKYEGEKFDRFSQIL